MSRPFILVGDRIDHGGSVVSGDPTADVGGRPMARVGDRVVCEIHGPTSIVSGDSTMLVGGAPVARHGDRTACGAVLFSSQSTAFIDDAPSVARSRSAAGADALATAGAAALAAAASSMQTRALSAPALSYGAGLAPGNVDTAREAVRDANASLRNGGAYRAYGTEAEAAAAWREHVLPVADEHGVEIGALISQTPDGSFHLGGAYSSGAYDNIQGLVERAPHTQGKVTASIHTHPIAGGWVGRDRAFTLDDFPDAAGIGGLNQGGDIRGDLVSSYYNELNTYVADADGLHGWSFSDYVLMQKGAAGAPVRLGEAYRTFP